jgi:drug/metabolite transporter (DMT)-like permease
MPPKSNLMQNNSIHTSEGRSSNLKWYLAATGSAALIALVTIATKGGIEIIGKEWFLTLMFAASIPFLIPYRLITSNGLKEFSAKTGSRKHLLYHSLCTGSAWILYANGVTLLTASVAVFVSRIEGIAIILFAGIFLKERLGFKVIFAAFVALVGLVLIDQSDLSSGLPVAGSNNLRQGILFIVGSALLFAGGEIFARKAIDTWNPQIFTLVRNLLLLPVFLVIAVFSDSVFTWDKAAIGWAVLAAICGPVGARILYLNCIRYIPVSHAAVMTNSEPIFGFILGYLVFADRPTIGQIVGATLIGAAILTLVTFGTNETAD